MNVFLLLLRRSLAFVYDTLLLIAIFFIVTAVLLNATNGQPIQHPGFYLLLWLIGGVFFTSFWKHGGQTLGMRAWHLRVVNEPTSSDASVPVDATPPDTARLWIRYVTGTLLFGIGYLWSAIDSRSLTANDRLSHTEIVKDSAYLKKQA